MGNRKSPNSNATSSTWWLRTDSKAGRVSLKRLGSNGGALTKKREVTDKVYELIGLTMDQFQQVVLIPQGKFEEVLKADTSDRARLLKQLFPVSLYSSISEYLAHVTEERLKKFEAVRREEKDFLDRLASQIVHAIELLSNDIDHSLDVTEIIADDFDVAVLPVIHNEVRRLIKILNGLKTEHSQSVDKLAVELAVVEKSHKRWQKWQQYSQLSISFENQELEDSKTRIALERAREISTLTEVIKTWKTSEAKFDALQPKALGLLARLESSGIDESDRPHLSNSHGVTKFAAKLKTAAAELFGDVQIFKALAKEINNVQREEKQVAENKKNVAKFRADLSKDQKSFAKNKARLLELRTKTKGFAQLEASLQKLTTRLEDAERAASLAGDLKGIDQELKLARGRKANAESNLQAVTRQWRLGLSSTLAKTLVEGEPCPTCGSKMHPNPAKSKTKVPVEADVQKADEALEQVTKDLRSLERKQATLDAEIKQLAKSGDLKILTKQHDELNRKVEATSELVIEADELEEQLETDAQGIKDFESEVISYEKELVAEGTSAKSHRKSVDKSIAAFLKKYGELVSPEPKAKETEVQANTAQAFATLLVDIESASAAREQAYESLAPKLEELNIDNPAQLAEWVLTPKEIDAKNKSLAQRLENRQKVTQFLKEYQTDKAPTVEPLVAPIQESKNLADMSYATMVTQVVSFDDLEVNLKAAPSVLVKADHDIDSARDSYQQAKYVADLCAGKAANSVGMRLSLENWVLSDYLRRVLMQANLQLAVMTEGRYTLEISMESSDARRATGLDLSVFDVNTGQVRPATTLSGGETFMAALSLALGLADVVSGGSNYEIGALFVDEGFDSLDLDTLDSVIEVLRSLEEGGKVVGVISHVEGLKTAISIGIEVARSTQGSLVTINYPE
jgi:exonuclease SbcC